MTLENDLTPASHLLFLIAGNSEKNKKQKKYRRRPALLAVLTAELVIRHAETNFRCVNSGLII